MSLIKNVVIGLFITIGTLCNAQEYKQTIKTEFNQYITAIVSKDFEKSTDYMLPEFFEFVPKSQLIQIMEQTFNDPEIEIQILNPKVLEVKESKKIGAKFYALLSYSNDMTMKLIDTIAQSADRSEEDIEAANEEKEMRNSLTKESLETTFGKKNVRFDAQTSLFEIYSEKKAYAVSEDGITGWKFIVIEKKQLPLLKKILPKELTDKI